MVQRPIEKDQVRIVIKNLQPIYQEKLKFQSINTFAELFDVGTGIEDAIIEGKIKRDDFSSGIGKRPTYQGNQANLTNVNAISQPENRQATSYQPKDKKFTDLGISLSTALDGLVAKGLLKELEARPLPNPLPPGF